MNCRIAIVSLCVATGLLVGCQSKEEAAEEAQPTKKSAEEAPPGPAGAVPAAKDEEEAGGGGGGPCATAACQEACSAYDGDELKKCAKAFVDGCFGSARNAEECDPFGAAPQKRDTKEKKKEGVGSKPPPSPDPEPDEGPVDTFGTKSGKDNGSTIDLQDDEENDGPVEKTPDKRLLDRPHPD